MQRDKFETIQCSRLEVVDSEGNVRLVLNGGRADTENTGPQNVVEVLRKDGSTAATVSTLYDSVYVHIDGGSVCAHSFTALGTLGRAYLRPEAVGVNKPSPYPKMEFDPEEGGTACGKGTAPMAVRHAFDRTEEAVRLSYNEHGGTVSVYAKVLG